MPTDVFVEGKVDCEVVRYLCPHLNVPEPGRDDGGRAQAIRRAAIEAKLLDHRIVLVLDRDARQPQEIEREVVTTFRATWREEPRRHGVWFAHGRSAVRLVLAGLPGDSELAAFGVRRFAIDDYLARLLLDDEALQGFCAAEDSVSFRPLGGAGELRELLLEVMEVFRRHGS